MAEAEGSHVDTQVHLLCFDLENYLFEEIACQFCQVIDCQLSQHIVDKVSIAELLDASQMKSAYHDLFS